MTYVSHIATNKRPDAIFGHLGPPSSPLPKKARFRLSASVPIVISAVTVKSMTLKESEPAGTW